MTAALTDTSFDLARLFGACRHSWCLNRDCTDPKGHPDDVAIHEGRITHMNGLNVIPFQMDLNSGAPYAGPRIQFNGCDYGRIVAELTLDEARQVAALLLLFGDGEVPIGTSTQVVESSTPAWTGGASVTVTRMNNVRDPWGRDRDDMVPQVKLTVDNPKEEGAALSYYFDALDASLLARYIVAMAAEMSAC